MEFSVKKLVASFLVLVALTGAVYLAIYNFNSTGRGVADDNNGGVGSGQAFAGGLLGEEPGGSSEDGLGGAVNTSGNVTEKLGKSIFRRVLLNNPDGFEVNAKGEVVGIPAGDADIKAALEEINSEDLKPREVLDSELIVTFENSNKDIDTYFRKLADVLLATIVSEEYIQLISQSPDVKQLKNIEDTLNRADQELLKISIPSDALEIHKNLLSFIRSRHDFFSNIAAYEDDPAKAILTIEKQKEFLIVDLDNFKLSVNRFLSLHPEIGRVKNIGFLESAKNNFLALIGINKAKASGLPTIDILLNALEGTQLGQIITGVTTAVSTLETTIGGYVQDLLEFAQRIATEQLKNHLTKLFVQQVLGWTNNDGNQRFVYNWESFITDIEEEVTSDALDEIVPSLCGPFQGYVLQSQGYLGLSGRASARGRRNCPLTNNGANLPNFYKDFNNGGWSEYLSALSPTGNPIGSILSTKGYVSSRVGRSRDAKLAEVGANKGYLSQNICADGKEPGRGDVCADGSMPRATTPGGLVGDTLAKAFGAPLDRIVNANDLTDLLAALVNSAISGVLTDSGSRVRGVTGLAATGLVDRAGSPTGDVVCSGLTGGALSNCLIDAGTTQEVVNNNNANSEASGQARRIGTLWNDIKDANKESLDIITQLTQSSRPGLFKGFFDLINLGQRQGRPAQIFPETPGCPVFYQDNNQLSSEIREKLTNPSHPHYAERGIRRREVDEISAQIPGLKVVIEELDSEIDYSQLQNDLSSASAESLQNIITTYGTPEEIEPKKQIAKDRLTALRTLRSRIESNLLPLDTVPATDNQEGVIPPVEYNKSVTSQCNVPLPTDVFEASSPILINP